MTFDLAKQYVADENGYKDFTWLTIEESKKNAGADDALDPFYERVAQLMVNDHVLMEREKAYRMRMKTQYMKELDYLTQPLPFEK